MKTIPMLLTGFLVLLAVIAAGFVIVNPADREIYESSLLASVHLLTLAIGLSGVFLRGIYLRHDLAKMENLKRMFAADNTWGLAAILWIVTGLLRAFGGFDKGTDFYIHNPMFHLKMGLFGLVFALEIWPMVTFIKWRIHAAKNKTLDFSKQKFFAGINFVETILTTLMVFVAGFMARGIF